MQLSFKRGPAAASSAPVRARAKAGRRRLSDLLEGESAVIDNIDLPTDMSVRLMELGFLPGATVTAAWAAPGGDPRVFRVDGSEIALRRDTAIRLTLKI